MSILVSSQAYVFLWSILGGALIAFIYDLFRIKRKAVKTISLLIHLEDFLYWILVALVMFGVVYYSNEGEIRGYIFIGTVLGAVLYSLMLSRLIVASSMFVIGIIMKVLLFIWRIISYPFKLVFRILSVPAKFFGRIAGRLLRTARRAGRNKLSSARVWGRIFRNRLKKY